MPWSTNVAVQLRAGNTIINPNGVFTYSGTPAFGNLIETQTAAAGTDSFGNAYLAGTTVYTATLAAQLSVAQINWYSAPGPGGPWTVGAQITSNVVGGSNILLSAANQTVIGNSGNCIWQDGVQNFILPAAGGPFISGESFHTISGAAGLSGTFRVKKLPWNFIAFEGEGSFTYSGSAQTFTLGNLPDATYYPTVATPLHRPIAVTGTPSGIASTFPRLFIPGSGGPQVLVPSGSGAGNAGWSVQYPVN